MGAAIPSVNFGLSSDFSLGVEEELLLVDRATHALDHGAVDILGRLSVAEGDGGVHPDYYAAMIELALQSARTRPRRLQR
jgi:gamma-glutamyl:cysteine ligase YbdK (ATP-grasp superfamily)